MIAAAALVAACGSASTIDASSSVNNGVIVVAQAATYAYTLSGDCVNDPPGLGNDSFRIKSDSGAVDYLSATGSLYLTPGNWTAQDVADYYAGTPQEPTIAPIPCTWTLTLTPSS
jgi:hypothetical protein